MQKNYPTRQQHFKRCQASGLTRRAYCTGEGLAISTFDRWRSLSRSTGDTSSKAALTLVPVAVERPLLATLKSPAGWEIKLPATPRQPPPRNQPQQFHPERPVAGPAYLIVLIHVDHHASHHDRSQLPVQTHTPLDNAHCSRQAACLLD